VKPGTVIGDVSADGGPEPGSLAARLEKDKEVPAKVMTERAFLESQTQAMSNILLILAQFLGVIMGAAAILTATNTMLSAIAARTHEIGILLSMGYRPVPIFLSFQLEALFLGLLGGAVGCLFSLPFNGIETGTMNFQTFTEFAFAFRVTWKVLVTAVLFSLVLGLLGGALPAWRAARMKPTTALRQG
jgi:putative ABC transport system permease protein